MYDEIYKAYCNDANIIHVDSGIKTKDIYEKYRKQYCSRICLVIDKDNRIVDKFDITDWKTNLPKILTHNK